MPLLLLALLCLSPAGLKAAPQAAATAAEDPVVVITNASVEKNSIARKTLRAIFGMRKRNWGDGESITVYVLGDRDPRHLSFCERILGMLPYNLRRHWDRLIFSGTGRAPIRVSSAEEMLDRVRSTPGSIGYVSEDVVDESVSVLQIG